MPRLLAASISTRSSVVPSRIETHDGQASQASPSLEVRAVDRLGEDPRERGLARAARPDEQDRVRDPPGPDRVAERLDDRLLADDLAERLRAPAAVEGLVRDGLTSIELLRSGARGIEVPCTLRRPGRPRAHHDERLGPGRSAAPDDDRLVLLPSGPDTVRGSPLRGTRSSTSHRRAAFERRRPREGIQPCWSGLQVQGTASSPPSTAREGYPVGVPGASQAGHRRRSWPKRTRAGCEVAEPRRRSGRRRPGPGRSTGPRARSGRRVHSPAE